MKPIENIIQFIKIEISQIKYRVINNYQLKQFDIDKRSINGSLTVEATLIMPIIILAIFSILYLTFYLHDTYRIQGEMDKVIHKSGLMLKHESQIETGNIFYDNINNRGVLYPVLGDTEADELQIQRYLQKELSKGLYIMEINGIDVTVDPWNISVSLTSEAKISIPLIKNMAQSYLKKEYKTTYPKHNPEETIRMAEVILDTGSKIKGMDELKENLEGILKYIK
jgi:hypothetical protein